MVLFRVYDATLLRYMSDPLPWRLTSPLLCCRVGLIFSNWLLMYLSTEEVRDLFSRMLGWLEEDGFLFFRESCFRQSGTCVCERYACVCGRYACRVMFSRMLGWLEEDGFLFFQESCFHQSGVCMCEVCVRMCEVCVQGGGPALNARVGCVCGRRVCMCVRGQRACACVRCACVCEVCVQGLPVGAGAEIRTECREAGLGHLNQCACV